MADLSKSQQRDELHKAIWGIADNLRGSVDGWDFKSYVLGIMFYRYISENLTNYINDGEAEAGNDGFDYACLADDVALQARDDMVKTKGFFILPSELFCNVRARAAGDENLNMTLESVFNHIENSAKGSETILPDYLTILMSTAVSSVQLLLNVTQILLNCLTVWAICASAIIKTTRLTHSATHMSF